MSLKLPTLSFSKVRRKLIFLYFYLNFALTTYSLFYFQLNSPDEGILRSDSVLGDPRQSQRVSVTPLDEEV